MRAVKWIAGILFTLIALLVAAPFVAMVFIDQQTIKELAQDAVLESTGRELTLNGDISAKLSLQPSFSIKDAAISNADWGKAEHFAKLESLSLGLSIPALLKGSIEIGYVSLEKGSLNIEKNTKGELNIPSDKEVAKAEPEESAEQAEIKEKTRFTLAKLDINDMALSYHDLASGKKQSVFITSLDAGSLSESSGDIHRFSIVFDNALNIEGSASLSEAMLLLEAGASTLEGNNTISVDAKITDPLNKAEIDGTLSAKIITPATLPLAGAAGIPALNLQTKLSGNKDFVQLTNLNLAMLESKITGNASVRLNEKKPLLQADLQSDLIDLSKLKPANAASDAQGSQTASAPAEDFNPSPIPNIAFPASGLDAINANINLAIQTLKVNQATILKNVSAKAKLSNGALELKPFNFGFNGGQIEATLNYNSKSTPPSLAFNSNGTNIVLGDALKAAGVKDITDGKTAFALNMKGSGKNLHTWLDSSKGTLYTHVDNAQYKTPENLIKGYDFLSILRGEDTPKDRLDIACFVTAADINNGKAQFKNTTLKTPVAFVAAKGELAMKMMSISMTLKARSNMLGFADAVPPILIYGPLNDLSTRVDTTSTLLTVGKWALGSATGVGLFALVGEQVTDKLGITEDANPCMSAEDIEKMQKAQETNKENPIKSAEQSVKTIGKNAEESVKAIRDGGTANIKDIEKNVKDLRDGLKGLLGN